MIISKIGATFLQGFKDLSPSKSYLCDGYELTITNSYLRINKKCFNYFKGSTDLKIAYNQEQKAIALINTYHDDPNLIHVPLVHKNKKSVMYNSITNQGILNQINHYFPQLKLNEHYTNRILAEQKDIGKGYIIFRLKNNKQHKRGDNQWYQYLFQRHFSLVIKILKWHKLNVL